MNLDLFNINSKNLGWYKKVFTISFIFLAVGITTLVIAFMLSVTNILSFYPTEIVYIPAYIQIIYIISVALLCGTWSGSAYTRRQLHHKIPTFSFPIFVIFILVFNLLAGLIAFGLGLILFGLTAIQTTLCNEQASWPKDYFY